MTAKAGPRCYFSLRSPYSWLALRKLEARGFGIGSAVEYLPYFEPPPQLSALLRAAGGRILYAPMGREKHFYILGDVKRLLVGESLIPKWPSDRNPDWSIPHLAFLACESPVAQRAFLFAAMEARWLKGEDIWNWAWVDSALQAIVAPSEASRSLTSAQDDRTLQTAVEVLYRAYRDDVFGVPFLVVGREKFWGLDRVDAFVSATSGT